MRQKINTKKLIWQKLFFYHTGLNCGVNHFPQKLPTVYFRVSTTPGSTGRLWKLIDAPGKFLFL